MSRNKYRRVLVRTFPPSSNPNFGGILQAWALQRVLASIGLEAVTDGSRPENWHSRGDRRRQRAKVHFLRHLPRLLLPRNIGEWAIRASANQPMLRFPRKHISEIDLFCSPTVTNPRVLSSFDAFVAGSDQVWRPDYVDVAKYLFDFLPDSFTGPRVAYAASFGSDSPLFSDMQRSATASLAARLTAVSVREESGVMICRSLWGIEAEHLVDPTLLLAVDDYRALIPSRVTADTKSVPTQYVLDRTGDKLEVLKALESRFVGNFHDLYPVLPSSFAEYRRERQAYDRPTVEGWLSALSKASFVATDSFHGSVFSILFERPFVTLPNAARGSSRFTSLLRLFGLERRLVTSVDDAIARAEEPIDWAPVRSVLSHERAAGIEFLRNALGE